MCYEGTSSVPLAGKHFSNKRISGTAKKKGGDPSIDDG
jgi:hypothetical protein